MMAVLEIPLSKNHYPTVAARAIFAQNAARSIQNKLIYMFSVLVV